MLTLVTILKIWALLSLVVGPLLIMVVMGGTR